MGEHADSAVVGATDLAKAIWLVSCNVVLTVGTSSIIEASAADKKEDEEEVGYGYGYSYYGYSYRGRLGISSTRVVF